MYAPLADTSRRLKQHAADIDTHFCSDRALSREASTVKLTLLQCAALLQAHITNSQDRAAASMSCTEAYDRMKYARKLNRNSLIILEKALLWNFTAVGRKKIDALQMHRKRLHLNHPRRKEIDEEIERTWRFIGAILHKDDGGGGGDSDGGDGGGGDSTGTSGNSGTSTDTGSSSDSGPGGGASNYNPDEPRIPAGQPGGGQWTSGGASSGLVMDDSGKIYQTTDNIDTKVPDTWANPDPLRFQEHYYDHASDFGAQTPQEYAAQANQFYQISQDAQFPAVETREGWLKIYDPQTNTFGVYNPEGKTETFFKPTPKDYFANEMQITIAKGGRIIEPLPMEEPIVPDIFIP